MKFIITTKQRIRWGFVIFIILFLFLTILKSPTERKWIQSTKPKNAPQKIPKIIHQTWKNDRIPTKWKNAFDSCREKYPDYEFKLWTDEKSEQFIRLYYKWFLPTFKQYPFDIQRADAIRYFVLYHYGGIYLDLDVGCTSTSMDALLTYPAIIPKTKPIGYSNDMMASEPKHPFFLQLTTQLDKWNYWFIFPYLTVFFSTGPMFLNIQYWTTKYDVWILLPELYSEGVTKFFTHHQGSSWHSWDAWIVKLVWSRLYVLAIAGILVGWYFKKRSTKRPLLPV